MLNKYTETQTVSGTNVRIYATDTGEHGQIHGAYDDGTGNWYMVSWQQTGFFHPYDSEQGQHHCSMDLISTKNEDTPE